MAAPSAPAPRVERGVDAYGKPFEAEVGGGIAPPGAMGQPLAPFGAAAPAPAAPTAPINAIAPVSTMPDVNALRRQYSMAVAAGSPDAPVILKQVEAALRGDQNKPMAVSPGQVVIDPITRQPIFTAPDKPVAATPLSRLIAERDALPPNSPIRAQYDAAIKKETTQAPGTTVNVSTEKKYGERFGGLIADRDAGKLDAAEGAPRVIENADRIMDILATGKVFTGTGANVRLQLAKALNLAGGTDTDRIANTEVLISSLANSTLGAIKSSNLGAGQGFTNADRDFLEKASAGQLTYDSTSLRKLAELGRKAGVASIESWNSRVQQIPKSALEGLGISASPLPVPSRRPSSVMNIPQGAIDMLKSGAGTREQFDAQFGPGSADRVLPKGK